VANNTVTGDAGDDIVLYDGSGIPWNPQWQAAGLTVSGNKTNRNAYDGIHVDATPPTRGVPQGFDVTLNANSATSNGNLGLDAPGSSAGPPPIAIVDGGDNTARGNGQKIQCRNIVCAK